MQNPVAFLSRATFQERARAGLAEALASGQIVAAFQPKVTLATRELIGVEALARWTSPSLGVVAPEVFVPLAEQEGLIGALTQVVLRDALQTAALLCRHAPGMTMAVNISPILLSDPNLPDQIDRALCRAGLAPSAFVAEITESHVIQDVKRATATLGALRARGIGCSIDDFGTGHASLLSLLRLPFSELKIDRAFIARCVHDRDAERIVRATLGLAREMELHVVAEGIETGNTEALLRELGCESGQGFRYGRPIDAATMLAGVAGHDSLMQAL
jgi:EAL domain-containing protein (putative c-di-GMP-specific phosphodiesterase class I)